MTLNQRQKTFSHFLSNWFSNLENRLSISRRISYLGKLIIQESTARALERLVIHETRNTFLPQVDCFRGAKDYYKGVDARSSLVEPFPAWPLRVVIWQAARHYTMTRRIQGDKKRRRKNNSSRMLKRSIFSVCWTWLEGIAETKFKCQLTHELCVIARRAFSLAVSKN